MKFFFAVISQTWRNITETWRSQLLSLMTITLSVLIFAFFYLVYMNALHAGDLLNNDLRLIVYLEEQPDYPLQEEYRHKIEKFDKVEKIEFVSRLEAYDRFKEQLHENQDVLQEVPRDFLPASIEIYPKRTLDTLSRIKLFSEYLQALPGVLKVQYGREWVERFYSFVQLLRIIVFLSGALLVLTTTFMMGHSIRLTMLTRKKELELLRLVGASDNYIRVPFFLEGALLGAVGAGAGIGALYLLFSWIALHFSGQGVSQMFPFSFFSGSSVGIIILLAMLLCAGGSFTSTHKILNL